MLRISRIRLVRVGHPQAWFPDVVIETTDLETQEPCDTILFGANGDGKSTLIALVLSCFETATRNFLKHLSKKSQEFHEYFGPEPGFILVEWQKDSVSSLFQEDRAYLVTGQVVAFRPDRPSKTERMFFLFDSVPELNLGTLPIDQMTNFNQVRSWASEMDRRYGNDRRFFHTEVQETWHDALNFSGIDVKLLGDQVHFSISEGGMDDAFLNFPNEDAFLGKFFDLTLNQQNAEKVREEVQAYAEKSRERPVLRRRLAALVGFRPCLATFAERASAREASRTRLKERGREASGYLLALRDRAEQRDVDRSVEMARQGRFVAEAIQQQQMRQQAEAETEALGEERLRRQLALNKNTEQEAQHRLTEARTYKNSISVARIDRKIRLKTIDLTQVTTAIAQATKDLEPTRCDVRLRGGWLYAALNAAVATARQNEIAAGVAVTEASAHEKLARAQEKAASEAITAAGRDLATALAAIRSCTERRAELIAQGTVLPDEGVGPAEARWRDQERTSRERGQDLEAAADRLSEEGERISAELLDLVVVIARLESEIHREDLFLKDAGSRRKAIATRPALMWLFEVDGIDPDAPSLPSDLEAEIKQREGAEKQLRREIEILAESQRRIEETGLAFHDEDVALVVDRLEDAGVTAKPYAHYIAKTVSEKGRARALVTSDPARFLGVWLPNSEKLRQAREKLIAMAPLPLRRPVVLSLPCLDPVPGLDDRFVLGPQDDTAYDTGAAQRLKGHVEVRLHTARIDMDRLSVGLNDLRAARQELDEYLRHYGERQRVEAQQRHDKGIQDRDSETEQQNTRAERQTAIKGERIDLNKRGKQAEKDRGKATVNAELCADFGRRYESRQSEWTAKAKVAEDQRAAAEFHQGRHHQEAMDAHEHMVHHRTQVEQYQRSVRELTQEMRGIAQREEQLGAVRAEPLDDLRQGYHTAHQSLIALEQGRVQVLETRRDGLQAQLREAEGERLRAETPWDETMARSLSLLEESRLDEEASTASDALADAGSQATEQGKLVALATEEFRRHRADRRFSSHVAAQASTMSSAAVSALSRRGFYSLFSRTQLDGNPASVRRWPSHSVSARVLL